MAEHPERSDLQMAAVGAAASANGASSNGAERSPRRIHNPLSPYRVRLELNADMLSDELRDL